ncbi:hypothetical protein HC891_27925 [Candidatus Gracilibacteria bacterium]|nr:hypothetical protein [Candidatus Gracilibacteria bacterium]
MSIRGSPVRLTRIVDAVDAGRALTLTYNGAGQLATVSDGTRTVSYTYLNDDLHRATDVMGRTTTYTYQNHMLTGIDNALGEAIERTTYDAYTPEGRVIAQTLHDGQALQVQYLDASTIITTTGVDGRQEVKELHYFDPRSTLTGISLNGIAVQGSSFDSEFSPSQKVDGNGNTTAIESNALGQPTDIQNALGQQTRIDYDELNRPITITDSLNRQTTMAYDAENNLIRQTTDITTAVPLGFTTRYTYTNSFLTEQRGPDGVSSRYDRNSAGQVLTTTVGAGTSAALVTTYGYDALGRVVTTTVGVGSPLERADVTTYNADNTVAQTIQHSVDGVFDAAVPDEDLITRYGYDALGRQVWVQTCSATMMSRITMRRAVWIGRRAISRPSRLMQAASQSSRRLIAHSPIRMSRRAMPMMAWAAPRMSPKRGCSPVPSTRRRSVSAPTPHARRTRNTMVGAARSPSRSTISRAWRRGRMSTCRRSPAMTMRAISSASAMRWAAGR